RHTRFSRDWSSDVCSSDLQASEGFDAEFALEDLGGRLRDRPLQGRGRFELRGDAGSGALELALGGSRVQASGQVGDRIDVQAQRSEERRVGKEGWTPGEEE